MARSSCGTWRQENNRFKTNDENMQAQFADQRADYGKKIAEIKSDMVESQAP